MSLLNSQHLNFGANNILVQTEITELFYTVKDNSH